MKKKLLRLLCYIGIHDWKYSDYILGLDNNNEWFINVCEKCGKVKID